MTRIPVWLVLADARRASLLHGEPVVAGRYRFEPTDSIEDDWEEKEHGRPSGLAKYSGYTFAGRRHEDEERIRRFAGRVCRWLSEGAGRWADEPVALFAPPRLLGALRQQLPSTLATRLSCHEGELLSLRTADLPDHPAVRPVTEGAPTA